MINCCVEYVDEMIEISMETAIATEHLYTTDQDNPFCNFFNINLLLTAVENEAS